MDQSRPMEPLLAEEKIVFGLLASQAKVVSMKELSHTVSAQEYRAISKEVMFTRTDTTFMYLYRVQDIVMLYL